MYQSKNRRFILVFSLLVIILLLIFRNANFNHFQPVPGPIPATTKNPISVTTIIDLDTKRITSFTRDASATASALTLLEEVATRQNLLLVTKQYSFGTLVESIGGLKNSPVKAWIYFVNDRSANVGADSYKPSSGDTIEWKYIKPSF
jgi:hypothetical protein